MSADLPRLSIPPTKARLGLGRVLFTWAAVVVLAIWMAVGLCIALVWCVPTWALSTVINWGLDRGTWTADIGRGSVRQLLARHQRRSGHQC